MHLLWYRRDKFFVGCVLFTGLLSAVSMVYGQDAGTIYPIIENGRFGFIDSTGERVIEAKYDGAQVSSEGMAAVRLGYAWGFIDTQDSVRIKPQFSSVFPFANGAARVQSGQYWSFIDRT
ncbi:MAG: WG repeat-containing protein, partial [Rhodothermaceae bacterium]|nr:WG repeat-containing protein [Rhodothermaceae bacterium]